MSFYPFAVSFMQLGPGGYFNLFKISCQILGYHGAWQVLGLFLAELATQFGLSCKVHGLTWQRTGRDFLGILDFPHAKMATFLQAVKSVEKSGPQPLDTVDVSPVSHRQLGDDKMLSGPRINLGIRFHSPFGLVGLCS